ncbi:hypothetical protein [Chitinophaga ginsengisegetis]|uniref:hypothetical protein n=1 Tax=Chitinophaga ginsengisegetis TaxID=393003 RepID=UPI000DC01AAD|nr:hypothetical protein [Chitinophaga ginsengisegetis]MDR6567657.1 hypothetical protein [Chitinophaga ginsengisegetis]MDR6647788.1 hypothetical protein [Chitinophaga ginsengisegetis]MDR6654138.1 hypothetical protein [Chitinophaga ginsengisegetis]
MDLRAEILSEHSRAQSLRIAAWIGPHPERFAALIHLFLHDEYRVVQRAAWIVSFVAERHPELLLPHLPAMVARMEETGMPVAVRRNVLRVLQYLRIPESLQGPVMNSCFAFLEDPLETVAVKAFSMTILANLAKDYPDIKNEIRLLIAAELENNPTPGIRSRARRVLKEIQ